jgi:SAM-dependent methyltransferase
MTTTATIDYDAIKGRQQAAWASGDYAVIGTTLQIVGETLAEACDLGFGDQVLDVAAGNGNATLAAARRGATVVSTDYVIGLLDQGRARARAENLPITFRFADAEALPFDGASFDAVLSVFGVMFAPDHATAAAEMMRVCRRGGRIGLANWTPDSFIGQLFKVLGRHVPPPTGLRPPSAWGDVAHLKSLFGDAAAITVNRRVFNFRYRSAAHFVEVFRNWYGPVHKAFAALPDPAAAQLAEEIEALADAFNIARDGRLTVPSDYLEVVIRR